MNKSNIKPYPLQNAYHLNITAELTPDEDEAVGLDKLHLRPKPVVRQEIELTVYA